MELAEAGSRLQMANLKASSKNISSKALNAFDIKIERMGKISGVATAIVCIWDGIVCFNKRDTDAGVAWCLAGIAFGAAAFLSGPVGWIVMGAGFLLVVLANLFTDTDLQYFFKHFMYSDHISKPPNGMSAMAYNRYLYKIKKDLVRKGNHEDLLLPQDANAIFHDLTVCPKVEYYTESGSVYRSNPNDKRSTVGGVSINVIGIRMNFTQFLSDADKLEAKGMFYNPNISSNKFTPLNLRDKKVVTLKNGQQQLQAFVDIPKGGNSNEFILAVRLAIDESNNHYFPYPLSTVTNANGNTEVREKRYLAAKFDIDRSIYHSSGSWSEDDQDLTVDTLPKLKLAGTW